VRETLSCAIFPRSWCHRLTADFFSLGNAGPTDLMSTTRNPPSSNYPAQLISWLFFLTGPRRNIAFLDEFSHADNPLHPNVPSDMKVSSPSRNSPMQQALASSSLDQFFCLFPIPFFSRTCPAANFCWEFFLFMYKDTVLPFPPFLLFIRISPLCTFGVFLGWDSFSICRTTFLPSPPCLAQLLMVGRFVVVFSPRSLPRYDLFPDVLILPFWSGDGGAISFFWPTLRGQPEIRSFPPDPSGLTRRVHRNLRELNLFSLPPPSPLMNKTASFRPLLSYPHSFYS